MKRNLQCLRLFIALFAMMCTLTSHAAVIPYTAPLQNFGGSSANLATFTPIEGDYTLEVQGSVGTQISVAEGVYTYTPTVNGTVRFSQKNGKVYVYEGNKYMTTLTPTLTITYPTITDVDAATNPSNMLQNSSFETTGSLVSGGTTNYNFGTPWVTNVTVAASGGIRIGLGGAACVNGTFVCIWRGTANSNYFAQPLSTTMKANTSYRVIVRQVAGSNAFANFIFGLGSTANGMEYDNKVLSLGNTRNGTWTTTLRTPQNATGTTFFTVRNTPTNTSNTGTDPLTQMDYLALVEGTVSVTTPGITGVSTATYLAGTAYAPENLAIDYSTGNSYDMTSYIVNPSFEIWPYPSNAAISGWTNVNSLVTQTNTPGNNWIKNGTVYVEKWVTSGTNLTASSLTQTISNIPNGIYQLTMSGHAIQQSNAALVTTGASVFAGSKSTPINVGGNYAVSSCIKTRQARDIKFRPGQPVYMSFVDRSTQKT
ncbi:MAG: hypothetical protein Q7U47_14655 [Paludibacter sp.]|nr:hypothetical protein [Paludibacter sp.]